MVLLLRATRRVPSTEPCGAAWAVTQSASTTADPKREGNADLSVVAGSR